MVRNGYVAYSNYINGTKQVFLWKDGISKQLTYFGGGHVRIYSLNSQGDVIINQSLYKNDGSQPIKLYEMGVLDNYWINDQLYIDIGNTLLRVNPKNPINIVTIKSADATATETGPTTGKFTVTRTGGTTSALTVKYALSGTATNGKDYNTLSGSVTIAAGASTATIIVTPKDDKTIENSETVIATLVTNSYYTLGTIKSATVTITDNDKNTVTISASDAIATEAGPTTGGFTVTRTGSTTSALTVKYTMSGTATNGTDYNTISSSVVIPAGSNTAMITVTPKNDTMAENNETVIATVAAGTGYNVGPTKSATVTIYDNDKTVGKY